MSVPALIYVVIRHSWRCRSRNLLILPLCIALLAGSCAPESPARELRIQVYLAAPVVDALVSVWWVDGGGYPLRKDGTRYDNRDFSTDRAVASATTDDRGVVVLDDPGFVHGSMVIQSQGGRYGDPWLHAEGSSHDTVWLSMEGSRGGFLLWSVVVDHVPPSGSESAEFVISPMTTLAKAIADRRMRLTPSDREHQGVWYETMRDTYALLGAHLGDVDLTRGSLPDWLLGMPEQREGNLNPDMPGPDDGVTLLASDEQARRGLVLAAFSTLAHQMAEAGGVPAEDFHAVQLLDLLLADVADDVGLLDGIGLVDDSIEPVGRLEVGACEPPDGCAGQNDDEAGDARCRPLCLLDSNTLRADLASALAFDFLGSAVDRSGMTLADILPLVEQLRTGQAPVLFGYEAPVIELGGPRPVVHVLPTTVYDEFDDTIAFDERGVPLHTSSGRQVELGAPDADDTVCPVLHKFVHRLDHLDDNAIRWEFEIADRRGASIEPDGGMYRLRMRGGVSGESGQDMGVWLTDWLPANSFGSVADGVRYEVVLLRSQIPALGLVSGDIEIEFRGVDEFGLETEPARYCWEHVPLAAPLQVRKVVEATGAGSLHETNLHPGNNLAPLLNGVPLEQGASVMDLEIVNDTAETVYVTFAIEQGLATFTKSWQKTNAFLFSAGESGCLGTGDCTLGFPPDRRTVIATDAAGIITELVSDVVVQDIAMGQRISPCDGCDPDEYRIEPRIALGDPRVYRVRLVVTDLRALAPQPLSEDFGLFVDIPLDAEILPTPITGQTFGRVRSCLTEVGPRHCISEWVYQHYVSLTEAALSLDGIRLVTRCSASPELPALMLPAQPGVLRAFIGIEAYHWATAEEQLPSPEPDVSEP